MKKYILMFLCCMVGSLLILRAQVHFKEDVLYTVSPAISENQVIAFNEEAAQAFLKNRQASDRYF